MRWRALVNAIMTLSVKIVLAVQVFQVYQSVMNKLPPAKRAQILGMIAEGVSIRAIVRLTGVSKNAMVKLLEDAGQAFSEYQDEHLRNLTCKRIQCDEIWSFVHCKAKNVATAEAPPREAGDIWTWVGIDVDTKLIPSYHVEHRDASTALVFMKDLGARLVHRVQLTTEGHKPYLDAVEDVFGSEIDYAMLVKPYGTAEGAIGRYSPAECVAAELRRV